MPQARHARVVRGRRRERAVRSRRREDTVRGDVASAPSGGAAMRATRGNAAARTPCGATSRARRRRRRRVHAMGDDAASAPSGGALRGDAASALCEYAATSRARCGRRRREQAVGDNAVSPARVRPAVPEPWARLENTPPRARYATTTSRVGCPLSNDVGLPLVLVGHVRAQAARARDAGARRGERARGGGEPGGATARLVRCGALARSRTGDIQRRRRRAQAGVQSSVTRKRRLRARGRLSLGTTPASDRARGQWGAARVAD
jgi:hypothetical protein